MQSLPTASTCTLGRARPLPGAERKELGSAARVVTSPGRTRVRAVAQGDSKRFNGQGDSPAVCLHGPTTRWSWCSGWGRPWPGPPTWGWAGSSLLTPPWSPHLQLWAEEGSVGQGNCMSWAGLSPGTTAEGGFTLGSPAVRSLVLPMLVECGGAMTGHAGPMLAPAPNTLQLPPPPASFPEHSRDELLWTRTAWG